MNIHYRISNQSGLAADELNLLNAVHHKLCLVLALAVTGKLKNKREILDVNHLGVCCWMIARIVNQNSNLAGVYRPREEDGVKHCLVDADVNRVLVKSAYRNPAVKHGILVGLSIRIEVVVYRLDDILIISVFSRLYSGYSGLGRRSKSRANNI